MRWSLMSRSLYNRENRKILPIERFHPRGMRLCKFIGTEETVCIRKEINSHGIGLGHRHGHRFIHLGPQSGRCDVM